MADEEHRRLIWRCRRGLKELDVLLERFMRERYAHVSSEQRRAFARLLELPAPELAGYLLGHVTPAEPQLAELARLVTAPRL